VELVLEGLGSGLQGSVLGVQGGEDGGVLMDVGVQLVGQGCGERGQECVFFGVWGYWRRDRLVGWCWQRDVERGGEEVRGLVGGRRVVRGLSRRLPGVRWIIGSLLLWTLLLRVRRVSWRLPLRWEGWSILVAWSSGLRRVGIFLVENLRSLI